MKSVFKRTLSFYWSFTLILSGAYASTDHLDTVRFHPDIDFNSGLGLDHAILEEAESPETQKFVQTLFLSEKNEISLSKVELLLKRLTDEKAKRLTDEKAKRLTDEKAKLIVDLKESTILELTSVDVFSGNRAIRKATEQKRGQKKIIQVYTDYLIPSIQILRDYIQQNQSPELWEGLIHDFIRAYHVFYAPNHKVTMWSHNSNLPEQIVNFVVPLKFSKNAPDASEAINLVVEARDLASIHACLGPSILIGHYLTRSEIHALKKCSFDISRLDPGVSPLWERKSPAELEKFKQGRPEAFPSADTPLYFDEVMLTGSGSPKVEVKALINGKVRKYKVKWGREAHTDTAAGNISQLLGFNQDTSAYRNRVRVYLGKQSFHDFRAWFMAKWGALNAITSIASHGGDPGNEWFEIQDALIEARLEEEVRALPFSPVAMDFTHRREFNGRILLHAFIGLLDIKIANTKLVLGKQDLQHPSPIRSDPRPRIRLRFHDLGYSFGPAYFLTNPEKLVYLYDNYLPNEFESEGIVTTNGSKDEVSVKWNDFYRIPGLFKKATYSDLKWMARKIASLKGDDLYWCLESAGMPPEVAQLYRHKLVSRKNEMIRAFELDSEPEFLQAIEEVPDLKRWSSEPEDPNDTPAVQNGEVVRSHFQGKRVFLKNKRTLLYSLLGLLNSNFSQITKYLTFTDDQIMYRPSIAANAGASSLGGVQANGGVNDASVLAGKTDPIVVTLGVGVTASIARSVSTNFELHTDSDSRARAYVVKDSITFQIGATSPDFSKLASVLPVTLQASIQFFKFVVEYYQYADSLQEGYTKLLVPFFKAIFQPIQFASQGLDRLELIRHFTQVGLEAGASLTFLNLVPGISNQAGAGVGLINLDDVSYLRDQYGQLHRYEQNTKEAYHQVSLKLGQIDIPYVTQIPFLMNYSSTKTRFHTFQKDYAVSPPDKVYSFETPIQEDPVQIVHDLEELKKSSKQPKSLHVFARNFEIEGEGQFSTRQRSLLGWTKNKNKTDADVSVQFQEGQTTRLKHHSTYREKGTGVPRQTLTLLERDTLFTEAHRTTLDIEMEKSNPSGLTISQKIVDYVRLTDRNGIVQLIEDLNRRFSVNPETPFFQDYFLPEEQEVNEYRKVYGVTRITISGQRLLDEIAQLDSNTFEEWAKAHFQEGREVYTHQKDSEVSWLSKVGRKIANYRLRSALIGYFADLKKEAMKTNRDYKKIFPLLDKFLYHQKAHKLGLGLLQRIIPLNALFVTGEIQGVLPSFATSNDLQERQRRRFVAKHWGTASLTPPVQDFNRYHQVLYPSPWIPNHIPQNILFGDIKDGVPEEQR